MPVSKQPFLKSLNSLTDRIEEFVVQPLKKELGNDLRIDLKKGMFERLLKENIPSNSISTGWTGSIDHLGNAFVLSELNGSPWENANMGNIINGDFFDVWQSDNRKKIIDKYFKGELLAPAHHKISHVDETLKEIRNTIGVLSSSEVRNFFTELDKINIAQPKNWDFL